MSTPSPTPLFSTPPEHLTMDVFSPSSTVAVTYQFVIVAVIAAGIFAAGVVTVMYRRRRRMPAEYYDTAAERYDWRGPPARTRLVLENGVFVEVPAVPKKRKVLGPEPKVWDVVIGKDEGLGNEKEKGVENSEDDYDAWAPTSLALPTAEATNPFTPPHLDATVLIAMPDPGLVFDEANPDAYDPPPKETTYNEYGDEEVDIPNIQLGTACVFVDGAWDDIEPLRPPPPPVVPPQARRVRRVRVDGFSRSLLRL